ncbi:DUF1194 domain-containing protein [Roseomonas alkaliterrae]|uniref:DUF1194 domain-containing protein n=1 Tax=Neoroseomonas alkaliterrae TaxID=1452450 RepID=A0A840XXY8_9PROT|nr:DUF1194 domain-containing protein [Neoroseomonas alkaliterrae]MBB5691479.1 hypothetical protein [Neoroseomonas alkaliterrae]MBR0675677.1 DUF1194 domain-containing protein [Neoroseomonas alkaliterrae]
MRRRMLLSAVGAAALPAIRPARAEEAVDVALVLAVDVSRSIDEDEARLQREGYRLAVSDPVVVAAIRGGMIGAVAIAYVEWAGIEYQRTVIPWRRIAGQQQADAWAAELEAAPRASLSWTSISGAIRHSRAVMAECPWDSTRKVIDVSGDGVNNSGPPADTERDAAVAEGITINGLPIINDRPTFGRLPPVPLDDYYRENVIGGTGAFMIVAEDFESFGMAVKRKLIREIANLPAGVIPA